MWFFDLVFETERMLPVILGPTIPRKVRIDEIQRACADHYDIKISDMVSARRTADLTMPRQVGYYLSKELTAHSMPAIGRRFGGRDHTTVLYGVRKITELRKTEPNLNAELQAIAASLGSALA
jgi:chromosomal replication initiator protein